jgi:hypothetical protein
MKRRHSAFVNDYALHSGLDSRRDPNAIKIVSFVRSLKRRARRDPLAGLPSHDPQPTILGLDFLWLWRDTLPFQREGHMLRILFATALMLAGIGGAWAQDVYVHPYYRNNGTYVPPHYRSHPDNSYNNNWSVSPNVNPHTWQQGTRQPKWNDQPQTNAVFK